MGRSRGGRGWAGWCVGLGGGVGMGERGKWVRVSVSLCLRQRELVRVDENE